MKLAAMLPLSWEFFQVNSATCVKLPVAARIGRQLLLATVLLVAAVNVGARSTEKNPSTAIPAEHLPREARETLALIHRGGPFPYPRDGIIFANRERRLPSAPRGTYREYTVPTPGSRDRGARRIIAEGDRQFWYTSDHYRTFMRIVE
ncbi:MAG: ribonuclease domain-containing protein [Betaproteobacteria bacterium]